MTPGKSKAKTEEGSEPDAGGTRLVPKSAPRSSPLAPRKQSNSMLFEDAVIEAVRSIPVGEVMTYGEVAELAGYPGRARGVGRILAISAEDMPWWRVVGAGLRLVSPSADDQRRLLRNEGWAVTGVRVGAASRATGSRRDDRGL